MEPSQQVVPPKDGVPLPFGKDSPTNGQNKASVTTVEVIPPTVNQSLAQQGTPEFFKVSLGKRMSALQNFLGNKENALRFMSAVMKCIETTPALMKCTQDSLMAAFMECAGLGLFPGSANGDCYVIPYKGKAQFQLGYRGLKTLAFRSGILKCGTEIVYRKDKYKEYRGTNPRIEHEPAEGDRGEPYRAYAWAEVSPGSIVFKSMSMEEIMKIKEISPAKDSDYSPWNSKNDPELWMWQKTAFKQMGKLLPTSDRINRAIYLDNVSERGGYIDGDGSVVEEPFNTDRIEAGKDRKEKLRAKKGMKSANAQSHE